MIMTDQNRLILFTRFPEPGKTKTRMIPQLGAEGAARLQRRMTEHAVRQARRTGVDLEVRYTGGTEGQMCEWLGGDLCYADQGEGDLGARMERAFAEHFAAGAERVVIVGSDCPANDARNMAQAFQALESHDGVIGPAQDGGYYLIGFCREGFLSADRIFQHIGWGGEQVLEETLRSIEGLSMFQLQKLDDVDVPEDIPPQISVIIPTLNEEVYLGQTLEPVQDGFYVETIVVDGGSTDGTQAMVPVCLTCAGGRAAQQNRGAAAASGEILLFLHADTLLPEGWEWIVRKTLSDPSIALGAFTFGVKERMPGIAFIEQMTNWRSRSRQMPYGDQALFMKRNAFEELGGFPEIPIMEDYELVRVLRKRGRVVTVPEPAITSGRRWREQGVFKVTLINKLMILGYHLGLSSRSLARLYRGS